MTTMFATGVLAGYGIAIPVGAIAVLIMDTAMRRGFRQGAAAGAGAATADLVYASVAAGAGGLVVPLLAPISSALRIGSGVLLLALATHGLASLRRRGPNGEPPAPRDGVVFLRFLALTIVNPLTVVYFAALVLASPMTVSSPQGLAAFATGAFLASLSWQTLLAAAGSSLGAKLPQTARIATGAIGNAMILAFGIATLATTF